MRPLECFDVMGEARDAVLSAGEQAELVASADAVRLADAGDFVGARRALEVALTTAKGTAREPGYRLRLSSLERGEAVIRLAEK